MACTACRDSRPRPCAVVRAADSSLEGSRAGRAAATLQRPPPQSSPPARLPPARPHHSRRVTRPAIPAQARGAVGIAPGVAALGRCAAGRGPRSAPVLACPTPARRRLRKRPKRQLGPAQPHAVRISGPRTGSRRAPDPGRQNAAAAAPAVATMKRRLTAASAKAESTRGEAREAQRASAGSGGLLPPGFRQPIASGPELGSGFEGGCDRVRPEG